MHNSSRQMQTNFFLEYYYYIILSIRDNEIPVVMWLNFHKRKFKIVFQPIFSDSFYIRIIEEHFSFLCKWHFFSK